MSRFAPPHCPFPDCPSRCGRRPFTWRRRGTYPRKCDGRRAQRFLCHACRRSFSAQRFRLDHRLQLPGLHLRLFPLLVAKVTHRQAARQLGVDRKTVARRLRLLGDHCRDFHAWMLRRCPGLRGPFQLDELETFEGDRRSRPLTVPVLIEKESWFVVHVAVGTLPARGRRRGAGGGARRRSQSREVVEECFARLAAHLAPGRRVDIQTDRKRTYGPAIRRTVGARLAGHERYPSTAPRKPWGPLFRINHTLALVRDGVSRLVRRTWGVSKRREWLLRHLWVWVAYRNYVRPATVVVRGDRTPGERAGVSGRRWTEAELLRWRVEWWEATGRAA